MRGGLALLALALAGCSVRTPTVSMQPTPRYVVGAPYQLGGTWSYPQERFDYRATGLAERLPDRTGLAADGQAADPTAMVGAHRTLQLPAIVDVINLQNGRQIRIRLDDRGPATPGRLLGLSRRAADLLAMPSQGAVPVRVELDGDASQELRDRLGGGPRGITAAPVATVSQEVLAPPGQSRIARVAPATPVASLPEAAPQLLGRLPETVRSVSVPPGELWVRVADFSQRRYADVLRNRLGSLPVQVRRDIMSRQPSYTVLAGPFTSVPAADEGLDRVRAAGVTDATIVVE